MKRGRAYRRYKEDIKVIKRLKNISGYSWYRYTDVNNIEISQPYWFDHIGDKDNFNYKTLTTTKWDTRNKIKWGLKGKKSNYYDSSDPWTRIKDKKTFLKLLKEEGYNHLPNGYRKVDTELGPELAIKT